MMRIDRQPHKLFKPETVEKVAAEMQEHDEDWTYIAKHDPKGTGYSVIEIYDEDAEFVGLV